MNAVVVYLLVGLVVLVALSIFLLLFWLRSRAMFHVVFTQSVDGMVVVDHQGIVLFMNRAAPRLLHKKRRELLGKLFIAPDACGENTEISVHDQQANVRTLEIRKGDIQWKGHAAFLMLFRDVTQRRVLEQKLRVQEERFQAMAANVPGVIYQWYESRDGCCGYNYISPRCEELLGMSAARVRDEWRVPRLYPNDPARWEETLRNVRDETIKWSFERSLTTSKGKTLWIRDLSRPQVQEEDCVHFNGVLIDVTGEKKASEALVADRRRAEDHGRQLEEHNRKIEDSIRYAQRIQDCILKDTRRIISQFPDAFIYLRPRDMVSGDFYWFARVGDVRVVVCADCTGHGVPGAFMTLLGNDLLQHVVSELRVTDPATILEQVDQRLREVLSGSSSSGQQVKDGMEMAVCCLRGTSLNYAGARLPLYLVRNGILNYKKGSLRAIGAMRQQTPFEIQSIELCPGDILYLATDGFQDQFGGVANRKYMRGRFKELLLEMSMLPMEDQARQLNSAFEHWKQDEPQIDDVLVMGIRPAG